MTATRSLTKFYGSFFLGCAELAVCPYIYTMKAFMGTQPETKDLVLGIGACIFFSTVVPVLPGIASLTFAIASFAASIALATMFVAYPLAVISDALDSCHASEENDFDGAHVPIF